MAREIVLTRGMVTLVDDADYEWLSCFRWRAVEGRRGSFYASRSAFRGWSADGKKLKSAREMQRDVLDPNNLIPGTTFADHRNGDTLDNRQSNLRWADGNVSNINRRLFLTNTSGYRGVYSIGTKGLWRAQIRVNGHMLSSGRVPTREQAALAYNDLARTHYGENAMLNVVADHG